MTSNACLDHSLLYLFISSLLLADLELAYNTLLVSANSTETVKLAAENPFTETTSLNILEAKTIAMFDLNAFMEIASAKSSIIGVSKIMNHKFVNFQLKHFLMLGSV